MLNNVPVPGQTLGSSRDLINNNFATIDTAFSVNHVPYNDGSGNQGMHQFIQIPTAVPIIATGANQVALYSNTGPVSGIPELFFQRQSLAANSGYSITESVAANIGWTRLPSGIILKWARSVGFGGGSFVNVNLALTPGPMATLLSVLITPISTVNFDHVLGVAYLVGPNFSVSSMNGANVPNTTTFSYLAIGV